jgi:Mor family transcriptional regulator
MSERRSEFLLDLASHIASVALACGADREEAESIGMSSADEFAARWKSQHMYIPANLWAEAEKKHKQVKAEFTGKNHKELADKHGLHVRTIYKIIGGK